MDMLRSMRVVGTMELKPEECKWVNHGYFSGMRCFCESKKRLAMHVYSFNIMQCSPNLRPILPVCLEPVNLPHLSSCHPSLSLSYPGPSLGRHSRTIFSHRTFLRSLTCTPTIPTLDLHTGLACRSAPPPNAFIPA